MNKGLGSLSTEKIRAIYENLDCMETIDIIQAINDSQMEVIDKIGQQAEYIADAVNLITSRLLAGGRLIYLGAGTSGRLGIMDASECPPTFGVSYEKVQGLIAGGSIAMIKAVEGAEDNELQGEEDIKHIHAGEKDAVLAISASGRTPYCIGALKYARNAGCAAISLSCNKDAVMSQFADIAIEVDTGPEVIAGSTRLKAGTAQKIVLNIISSASMVKMGKTYKNLMVDMKVTNQKLRDRAIRILMNAATLQNPQKAEEILQEAEWNIKAAIVMAIGGVHRTESLMLLEKSGGKVRTALSECRCQSSG